MSICGLIIGWRIRSGVADAAVGYGLLLLFAFAMIWVGVLLGSAIATPEGVTGIAFVVLFPLTFAASTFVPLTRQTADGSYEPTMPPVLQAIAEWNPVTTLAERRAHPVRQPRRRPGPGPAVVDPAPARLHHHLGGRRSSCCARRSPCASTTARSRSSHHAPAGA